MHAQQVSHQPVRLELLKYSWLPASCKHLAAGDEAALDMLHMLCSA
jgi:hypothetical protein